MERHDPGRTTKKEEENMNSNITDSNITDSVWNAIAIGALVGIAIGLAWIYRDEIERQIDRVVVFCKEAAA